VSGNEKERKKEVYKIFSFFLIFFHMTDCIFISTHCNTIVTLALIVMNNIMKELVMIATHYDNQITENQNTISIIISNIDSMRMLMLMTQGLM